MPVPVPPAAEPDGPDGGRPAVSVVVATYQRAHRLPSLLAALDAQTLDPDRYEVVVVDNGATDDTADVLAAASLRAPLRVVHVDVNRGPARGRNAGWRQARGEVVAFTDDDCQPEPTWLEAGLAAIGAAPDLAVAGRTMPNPAQEANRGPFSRTQRVTDTRFMPTCNVFYRRADLEEVDGFDEQIAAKGGEDTDLAWRLEDRGRRLVFADDALVYHDISPSSYRAALREAVTWIDIPRMAVLHPERVRRRLIHRLFWKPSHEPVLLALVGVLAAAVSRRPVALLGTLPWLRHRVLRAPVVGGRARRLLYLPHIFVVDAAEVVTMARGSIRHRTLLL